MMAMVSFLSKYIYIYIYIYIEYVVTYIINQSTISASKSEIRKTSKVIDTRAAIMSYHGLMILKTHVEWDNGKCEFRYGPWYKVHSGPWYIVTVSLITSQLIVVHTLCKQCIMYHVWNKCIIEHICTTYTRHMYI